MKTVNFRYAVETGEFDIECDFPGPPVETLNRARQLLDVVRPNWRPDATLHIVKITKERVK